MGENAVEIDPAALASEVLQIAESAPAAAPGAIPGAPDQAPELGAPGHEPTLEQIEAIAAKNAGGMIFLVARASAIVAPNWDITADESRDLGNAAAVALAAWFPSGAIPLRYMVLLNLAGSIAMLADKRRDPETGELRPLKASPAGGAKKQTEAAPHASAVPA